MASQDEKNYTVPVNSEEVTEEWMCTTLAKALGAKEARRTWLYVAAQRESGMLSSIFRAKLDVEFDDGRVEKHKIFIKIMPQNDPHKSLVANSKMDVTEIESYRRVFFDLGEFEKEQMGKSGAPEDGILSVVPRIYAGGYNTDEDRRGFFLMLEDMTPEYEMKDYEKGLTPEEVFESMRSLAQIHATGYAYGKLRGVDFRKKYDGVMNTVFDNMDGDSDLMDFMNYNMDLVQKDMEGSRVEGLMQHVTRLRKDIGKKYMAVLKGKEHDAFLMHGDIWANNVLYGPGNKARIVDWQFTTTGSIFLDFGTMGWISMSAEETAKHSEDIIASYFDSFTSTCKRLGCSEVPWTREEFGRRARVEGLFIAFLWCSTSYELVEKYPAMKDRVHWVLEESVKISPKYYE